MTFSDRSRDVAMATNFSVKIGEIGVFTIIRRPGIQYRTSDFKRIIHDNLALATSCRH